MILIVGTFEVDPAHVEAFAAAAAPMMAASQAEAGCGEYVFSHAVGTAGTFKLAERWTDNDALAAHGSSSHMADFRAALADVKILSRSVDMFADPGEPVAL